MIGAAALTGSAIAGDVAATAPVAAAGYESSTCDALKSLGKVYKNDDNPFIQEVKIFGRAQVQYGYVSGSEGSKGYSEWRRLRAGTSVKFAKFFDAKVRANLEDGGANDHQIKFGGYDESYLGFRADKAFDINYFDKVHVTYGRHKIAIGEDVHTSSKKIKTVERSALTGKIRPDNNVGGRVVLEKGDWEGAFGVFSANEGDTRKITGDFEGGALVYLSSTSPLNGGEMILDLIINADSDAAAADYSNKWAASAAYRNDYWNWDWAFNAVLGDADSDNSERGGLFGGLVVQPSKFIWEDKLEFVGRYYFQASSGDEGIRVNSRYSRKKDDDGDVLIGNDGRGDMHHSIYGGLNYYLCGHNAKVMTGVELENLNTPDGGNNAATLWAAFRMYF